MPSFVAHRRHAPDKRKLQKVPFVELFDGRLQGVVSSGSSLERVYVSVIKAGSGDFDCRTNNNRPCGGLRGHPCKHLEALVANAVAQYGPERVARTLGVEPSERPSAGAIVTELGGSHVKEAAADVFSRFLDYLRYVELPASTEPRPGMAWFVTG